MPPVEYVPIPYARRSGTLGELARRQGEVNADRILRAGEISANAWTNAGNAIAGSIGAFMRERQEAPIRAEEAKLRELRIREAEGALGAQEEARAQAAQARAQAQQLRDVLGSLRQIAMTPDPAQQAQLYEGFKQRFGHLSPETTPETYPGIEWVKSQFMEGMTIAEQYKQMFPDEKPQGLMNVPAGGVVYDPETKQPIYTNPREQEQGHFSPGGAPRPVELNEGAVLVDPTTGKEIARGRPRTFAPDRSSGGGASSLSPSMEANVINRLTNQWTAASKPARELDAQVRLMDAGIEAARRGDLAQGAQTVLVTFQKILDPKSVVREAEFERSAAGQSLMNRAKGAMERLAKGGAGIPLPELEKFAALAREVAEAQRGTYLTGVRGRLGRTADRYGIPKELVFEDDATPAASAAAAPAAGTMQRRIPGIEGGIAESTDGGKTWKRVK